MPALTALVTGATSGIGYELACRLADRGYNLVLASRNAERMEQLRRDFTARRTISVDAVQSDLSTPGSAQALYDACRQRGHEIEVLVNNSGFGIVGRHLQADPGKITRMAQLNMASLTELCTLFAPAMVQRGRGYILNVASTAAFQAIPFMAEYAATKAYVLHFSLGLAGELAEQGVRVSCLCPGPTQSNFFAAATADGAADSPFGTATMMTADVVAEQGLAGLFAGKLIVIPGAANKFKAQLNRLFSRRMALAIVKGMFAKMGVR